MREEPYKNMALEEIKKQKKGPKVENPVVKDPANIYPTLMQQVATINNYF